MSLYPAGHSTRQSQTTTAGFTVFFEVGVGGHFLEIEGKKGGSFDAHLALSSALHAVVVIPMAAEDFAFVVSSTTRAVRQAFSAACVPQRVSNWRRHKL